MTRRRQRFTAADWNLDDPMLTTAYAPDGEAVTQPTIQLGEGTQPRISRRFVVRS